MAAPGRRKLVRTWHRWIGGVAALPLLWLAVSGVLLNHADRFGLHDREVTATWVLKRYNQLPEGEARGVDWEGREDGVEVAAWDDLLFYQGGLLEATGSLVGASPYLKGAVIATEEVVYVVNADGTILDRLDDTILPTIPVEGVALAENGQLIVRANGASYRFDETLLEVVEDAGEFLFLPVQALDASERDRLELALAAVSGIPLSRVVLDLHSGKLLGWPGWLITDLSAVSLIVLTLLGLRLFPKRRS